MATNNSCDYSPTQYWVQVGGASGTLVNVTPGATVGLPFVSAGLSSNPLFAELTVPGGGTGAATLTGVLTGNGTSAITANTITQYGTLVAGASNAVASVGPGSTAGVPLISGGSSANPSYGTALVVGGGTGAATFNVDGIVISNTTTTGALAALTLTAGQIVIGATGAAPVAGTITPGTGISVTNGVNSITIANTGAGFTWTDVTGGSATVAAQNGYFADKTTLTTFTLPANNALGDTIKIVGKGTGGWTVVYTTNQKIIFGSSTTTTTSGSLSSTNTNDCIELVCSTASASAPIFTVVSSIGNLTVA